MTRQAIAKPLSVLAAIVEVDDDCARRGVR